MELTEAGRRLAEHADRILTELDAAVADLRGFDDSPATLHVGAYASVSTRLLPRALSRLSTEAPDLRVVLHEDEDWERFLPLVATCALDAAFAELPLPAGPFTFREVARDPYVLVVAADSPLAERTEPPTLEDLGSLPLIVPSSPALPRIAAHLRAVGVEPRLAPPAGAGADIQSLVAAGAGPALLPRLVVDEREAGTVAIGLNGAMPPRRVCLCWHRHRRSDSSIQQLAAALGGADEQAPAPTASRESVVA